MEPRASLSAYTVAILLGALAISLRGFSTTAWQVCLGISALAALLEASYLVRRHKRRMLVFPHRRYLDRIVRAQWTSLAIGSFAIARGVGALDWTPLSDAGPVVAAVVVGWTVMWATIYVSALVDWYWILPKVSGITSPPPCTVTGGKTFDRMTSVWLLHRGAATAVATFTLAAVPSWIAGTIEGNGSDRALLTLLGVALAIGFNAVNAGTVWALKQFNHPVVGVGWYLRQRKHVDDPAPQDAYVVDVAVSGIKYKLESEATGTFEQDGHILPFTQVNPAARSGRSTPICPSLQQCRAANWYCVRNRNANGDLAPDEKMPVPLPENAPVR